MRRRITYPSLNVLVAPVDVTVHSSADSNVYLGSVTGGFNFPLGGFNIDPYLKLDYQKLKIDSFREEGGDSGFELQVGEQDVESLDASLGLKMQYVFTPSFGVLVPYVRGELHKELENDQRNISSTYASLGDGALNAANDFDLATDDPDDQFVIAAAGFSAVFKHGLQASCSTKKSSTSTRLPTAPSRVECVMNSKSVLWSGALTLALAGCSDLSDVDQQPTLAPTAVAQVVGYAGADSSGNVTATVRAHTEVLLTGKESIEPTSPS